MKCPYQPIECRYVDTSTNTMEKSCAECECYNNGVKYSRGCLGPAVILIIVILIIVL
jgi:hypothetical protein